MAQGTDHLNRMQGYFKHVTNHHALAHTFKIVPGFGMTSSRFLLLSHSHETFMTLR